MTPSFSSERAAFAESFGGKPGRTRSTASTSRMRAVRGSTLRKSRRSVSRASSPICPAISTPVGPAPTTTNVSHASRACASVSHSAASNALRSRLRTTSALSSDFTSAAYSRHSSWPKYEYCEPPATISVSYGSDAGAGTSPTGRRCTSRASRSKSATSAISTRTLRFRLKIARSGYAISPGDSAPVATWYVSGWKRWKLRRSTSVISTGARLSFATACRPPKPPPITTTR